MGNPFNSIICVVIDYERDQQRKQGSCNCPSHKSIYSGSHFLPQWYKQFRRYWKSARLSLSQVGCFYGNSIHISDCASRLGARLRTVSPSTPHGSANRNCLGPYNDNTANPCHTPSSWLPPIFSA